MTTPESMVPSGWRSEETAGGADLRVASPRRRYISVVVGIFATLSGTRAILDWNRGSSTSAIPWVALTSCLALLVLWCAVGDEVWRLERNCVTHWTGIGPWGYSKGYRNADLEIRLGFGTKFGRPYYRLYGVENGQAHFLIERGEKELMQLAKFISFHTGWQIRAHAASTMRFE